jgi:hypothetical protein
VYPVDCSPIAAAERHCSSTPHDDAVTSEPPALGVVGLELTGLPIPRNVAAETIAVPADRGPGHWDSAGRWRLYLSCATTGTRHWRVELLEAASPDAFATSDDGIAWTGHGPALQPEPGRWDQRGTRVTAIIRRGETTVAFYDGRRDAAENWEERTGVAAGRAERLAAVSDAPVAQASGAYPALRYAAVVDDGDRTAVYYEIGCDDGSHELRREWFGRTS